MFSSLNLNIRQFYVKLHFEALGTVLGTLSLLLLAIKKLRRKLGTVLTKQSHNAIGHNTFQVPIGHLHDDVILLLRPESFRVLFSCANQGFCHLMLPGITRYKCETKKIKYSGRSSKMTASYKWPFGQKKAKEIYT